MKKILSLLLTLSLVFALSAGMAGIVSAEDYYGDEYYAFDNGDGSCTISYNYQYSDATEINIPQYVNGMRVSALADWCFDGFSQLETLVLPESLSYIGSCAFSGCESLKRISIPASVTQLSFDAFSDSSLSEINVSSGNRTFCSVDGVVFTKDKSMLLRYPCNKKDERYTIPSSVKKINADAFEDCQYLTSITIPNSVVSIGDNAFAYCFGLTSVTLPDSVTDCGSWLFASCEALQNVTISNSLTKIAPYMFYNSGLRTITIPGSVTAIGEGAFEGCWDLTAVDFSDSVVSIGNYAFLNCGGNTGIPFTLHKNVSYLGLQALSSAASITVSNENPHFASENDVLFSKNMTKLIQYPICSAAKSYTIPSTVTEIADAAFKGAFQLQSLNMPDSVVSIGTAAFCNSALTSAVISQGVQEIPESAFAECSSLTSVTLPEKLTGIGAEAFGWCYKLQNITLPASVQTLGENAFRCCKRLTEMVIPFGIIKINSGLFAECSSLTSLVLPSSVGEIYPWAFNGCNALSNVEFTGTEAQWNAMHTYSYWDEKSILDTIPIQFTGIAYEDGIYRYVEDGQSGKVLISGLTDAGKTLSSLEIPAIWNRKLVEAIAPYAFAGSSVQEAVLSEGIRTLGTSAFDGCHALEKISLPSTLISIGDYAFHDCDALQSLTIPDEITELGSAVCSGCRSLSSVYLPDGITSIADFAFSNCEKITSLALPESLKTIGRDAFNECTALESITLPDSVITVFDWAFEGCSNLNWVYLPENLSYLGYYTFVGCENLDSVFYVGSYTQWGRIECSDTLQTYCNATAYFNCKPVVGSFMDVKASDWFVDSVAYAYENELMNGVTDMLFNPSGSLTRGQLVTILYRMEGQPTVKTPANFSDVPVSGKYYSNAVAWAANKGIVNGYNDGTFKPNNQITREQIATILYRYNGSPAVTGTLAFPDVNTVSKYAKDAMTWAVSQNLINGIKSGNVTNLAPKNTATRAQIATIIMRYLQAK